MCANFLFLIKSLLLESELSLAWLHRAAHWHSWSTIFPACLVPHCAHTCVCLSSEDSIFLWKGVLCSMIKLEIACRFSRRVKILALRLFESGFYHVTWSIEWFGGWGQLNNEQSLTLSSSFVHVPVAMRAQAETGLPLLIPTLPLGVENTLQTSNTKLMDSSGCTLMLWKACFRLD